MKNAELNLVSLENGDVITTSGPDYVTISGLGNSVPKDALFEGVYKGQELYYDNATATAATGLFAYLSSIFDGNPGVFLRQGDKDPQSPSSSFLEDYKGDVKTELEPQKYNGYYEWDSGKGYFVWLRAKQ